MLITYVKVNVPIYWLPPPFRDFFQKPSNKINFSDKPNLYSETLPWRNKGEFTDPQYININIDKWIHLYEVIEQH